MIEKEVICRRAQIEAFAGKVDPAARYRCLAARVGEVKGVCPESDTSPRERESLDDCRPP